MALWSASPAGAAGSANTFTVSGFSDGPATASCTTPDQAGNSVCPSLRSAAFAASKQSNAPTIELGAGTYQLTLADGGQLAMGAFTIQGTGPGGSSGTVIEQTDGQSRVVEVQAGPATLSGLEVTGGHLAPGWSSNTTWMGGGILAQGPLVLQNVLVTGNEVQAPAGPSSGNAGDNADGGGVDYIVGSGAGSTISDSTITQNSALGGAGGSGAGAGGNAFGGGVAYEGTGPLVVDDSTISNNAATAGAGGGAGGKGGFAEGGGIWHSSDLTLSASTVVGNNATGGRGGAGAGASFGGNGSGGGIADIEALASVLNSTVFQNLAQGGAGENGGAGGASTGGGVYDTGSAAGAALQSDTIDANQASSDASNLFVYDGNPPNPYTFTLHDTIVAGGEPASVAGCDLHGSTNPASSESNNLEDDAADSCGFSAANHDLVGANPQLPTALGSNGGPTQTLAPAPGSPVLGTGGGCTDPTSTPPNQPLTVDQRGEPRPTPCDIGAFEAQRPRNTTRPMIMGTASRGHTLLCSQGFWTGDGSLQYAYVWLRNGLPIPGATTDTYVVGIADPGQSLSCRVTATYYGSATATTPLATVPSYPLTTLLRVRLRGAKAAIDLGCRGDGGQRCSGAVKLVAVEKVRGRRVLAVIAAASRPRVAVLAQHRYAFSARHTSTVNLTLSRTGIRLLERFRKLRLTLGITQTLPTGTQVISTRLITMRVKSRR